MTVHVVWWMVRAGWMAGFRNISVTLQRIVGDGKSRLYGWVQQQIGDSVGVWGSDRASWMAGFSNRSATVQGVWGTDWAVWMAGFIKRLATVLGVWVEKTVQFGWLGSARDRRQ